MSALSLPLYGAAVIYFLFFQTMVQEYTIFSVVDADEHVRCKIWDVSHHPLNFRPQNIKF